MPGAGWSALGAAIQGGAGAYAQRRHEMLIEQQMADQRKTNALQQQLLQDQVNELPDKHAEDRMAKIVSFLGPDAAANSPDFAATGRKLGIIPQNQLPAMAHQVEQNSPFDVAQPDLGPNASVKDVETPSGGGPLYGTGGSVPTPTQLNVAPKTGVPLPPHEMKFEKLKDMWGGENMVAFDPKATDPSKAIQRLGDGTPGSTMPSAGPAGAPGDPTAGMDPKMKQLATQIANYEIAPSPRAAWWPAAMTAAKQINPDFDETQYAARQGLRNDFTKGNTAQAIVSANKLVGHMDALRSAGEKLKNSNFPIWNQVANSWDSNVMGKGDVTAYNVKANAVAEELMKVFRGTGAGSVQEVQQWQQNFNSAQSPEQQQKALNAGIDLMMSRMTPLQSQWKNGMHSAKDFPIFNEASQKILEQFGFPQTPGAGPAPAGPFNAQSPAPTGAAPPPLARPAPTAAPAGALPPLEKGKPLTIADVSASMGNPPPEQLKSMLTRLRAAGYVVTDTPSPTAAGAPPRPVNKFDTGQSTSHIGVPRSGPAFKPADFVPSSGPGLPTMLPDWLKDYLK